jgi:hypothetical protein
MKQSVVQAKDIPESYLKYTGRKTAIIISLALLTVVLGIFAICAGSADLTPGQVVMTLLGKWRSKGVSQDVLHHTTRNRQRRSCYDRSQNPWEPDVPNNELGTLTPFTQ